ncbi:WSC domain-containing protein 2 [Lingula anatina]|uniref:WSC domain-containing protein 2 n=1 Tax=Lingula anatina TaxID=7574 RepID=A0A1S3IWL6_LINAN|nr:WSC domain-containing protein 2 [Lingula anatina]|eukprot:XP_013402580.1 WSC domain-containing protein 2 [Lingula anatina]
MPRWPRKRIFQTVLKVAIFIVSIQMILMIVFSSKRLPDQQSGSQRKNGAPQRVWPAMKKRIPLNYKEAVKLYNAAWALRNKRPKDCVKPVFSKHDLPRVALASYPGSGNTWVRHLVQQATGIVTGSEYLDMGLSSAGMIGEGYNGSNAIMIKTHEFGADKRKGFDKAVLIIRNPYDAMMSEFHRRQGGHLGHAKSKHFTDGTTWPEYIRFEAKRWLMFNLDWLHLFEKPLMVLAYSDLLKNTHDTVVRLTKFLNISVTEERIQCVLENSQGKFQRYARKVIDFDPYNKSMRRKIDAYLNITNIALNVRKAELDARHSFDGVQTL